MNSVSGHQIDTTVEDSQPNQLSSESVSLSQHASATNNDSNACKSTFCNDKNVILPQIDCQNEQNHSKSINIVYDFQREKNISSNLQRDLLFEYKDEDSDLDDLIGDTALFPGILNDPSIQSLSQPSNLFYNNVND